MVENMVDEYVPPIFKILRRHVNAHELELLGVEVAVVRPLYRGAGVVALLVGREAVDRQTHDLREDLADLVLGVAVLRGELQDCRQGLAFVDATDRQVLL